ncbi:MAG: CPXCG motif-containing cysteine-rich protein [Bdellovibrionales bacterium]|nr:CPXCG motif-containing cysteine-rich protein [Bdellovibrionales bacterium]
MNLLTQIVSCPYCNEPIELELDPSIAHQRYIEDCWVCCRPIEVELQIQEEGQCHIQVKTQDQ